jgi:putative intracellular protease/amidase
MPKPAILVPLPDRDFDVTEVAVPWTLLSEAGYEVAFATEEGTRPAADPLLLDGVVFGMLGARPEPIQLYRELEASPAFTQPRRWSAVDPADFAAVLVPGGHAQGMRQLLESSTVQDLVRDFWRAGRPVAAICHGVLVLARTIIPESGRSILHGRRTTCLPKYMERSAYLATFWRRGRYFRTYPTYVEDEVRAALGEGGTFERGPRALFARGSRDDDRPAFVVEDGHYLSARWPGDAYLFARRLLARLAATGSSRTALKHQQ